MKISKINNVSIVTNDADFANYSTKQTIISVNEIIRKVNRNGRRVSTHLKVCGFMAENI